MQLNFVFHSIFDFFYITLFSTYHLFSTFQLKIDSKILLNCHLLDYSSEEKLWKVIKHV